MKLTISTSPHIMAKHSVNSIMRDVVIAMMPLLISGVIFFGFRALLVVFLSVCFCLLFEYLFSKYVFKKNTIKDFSAVITGLLLAFNLPATMPIGMIFLGSFVAIIIGKMVYGGLGGNVFNPALVGRAFLFISFPVAMTNWVAPNAFEFLNTDATTSATILAVLKNQQVTDGLPSYFDLFIGNRGGCIGETSVLAILIGFCYLLYRKVISWHIPFYYIGTVFLYCFIASIFSDNLMYAPLLQILSGGLFLGAVFMATDYTTSPMTKKGKIIFAVGCGILTCVIRFYGSYPEGVSFAILIMNAFVCLIDKYCYTRAYGEKA